MAFATHHTTEAKAGENAPANAVTIHVLAFGRQGYHMAAANLAASIAATTPGAKVWCHTDDPARIPATHRHLFAKVKAIPQEITKAVVLYGAGYVKARVYDLLPKGAHLVIDADTIVLKDLSGLLDQLATLDKPFACATFGSTTGDDKLPYFPWATPAQVRAKVGIDGARVFDVQTSWMFFRKPDADQLSDAVYAAFGSWDRAETLGKWGHGIPDELAYTTGLAALGMDPTGPDGAMFFGSEHFDTTAAMRERYYMLTLYGQGAGKTHTKRVYFEWYDRLMHGFHQILDLPHLYKSARIMSDKYVNTTKT